MKSFWFKFAVLIFYMKIVFFGTPEFAVISLKSLIEKGWDIAAVVTTPDKQAGRGLKLVKPEVARYAESLSIPVLQPENLRDPGFIEQLKKINAGLFLVVAFRKLPPEVWQLPPAGTVNLHASLLPAYRGAAPINHVIINGEKKTGVTTFFINDQIDTGEIIFQEMVDISARETAGSLHDKLAHTGASLLCKTVDYIDKQKVITIHQDMTGNYPKAPKITKEFCRINWEQPASKIDCLIRGLSPYPAAWTTLENKIIKIYTADFETIKHEHAPGTILTDNKNYLRVAAAEGFIHLLSLQAEGRKMLEVKEFLRGFVFKGNEKFK